MTNQTNLDPSTTLESTFINEKLSSLANDRARDAIIGSLSEWLERILSRSQIIAKFESLGTVSNPQITDVHVKRAVSEEEQSIPLRPGIRYFVTTAFRIMSPILIPVGVRYVDEWWGLLFLALGPVLTAMVYMMDYQDRYGRVG